ncbi:BZ3500_MvSof-1268-A1-R1_Chr1-3g02098 [Microbotryum saponariae]|uniref:Transmembrane protein 198 n=1 Tax=Microbotryum saponariae TaxID=289078 RepID=A0A2X0M970_9BASI|nr:BZ3500_MvSof-1268-A1-R1_Chr1-3g02098 [Microbotryum saponariae]SCZ95400.1 BZ3501_MvSof-1269-A2-R1_Chr1-3g01700 [Microbotryum saponariae]
MGRSGLVLPSPTLSALSALAWATLSVAAATVGHAPASGRLLRRDPDGFTSSNQIPYGGEAYYTNYRKSPAVVLTAVAALLAGVYFCLLGKRGWRFTTGLCTALMGQLLTWIIVTNVAAIDLNGIAIWGFSMIGFVVGFAVGALLWRFGIVVAGADGGLALALGLNLMVPHQSNSPTWISIGVLSAVFAIFCPLLSQTYGMATCSLTGSFILGLGIDLFVEQASGFSLGLRYIFDQRHLPPGLMYQPSEVTRVFLGVMWGLTIIATVFQTWRWRQHPFERTHDAFTNLQGEHTEEAAGSLNTRSVRSEEQLRESRAHTFSMITCAGKHTSWEPQNQSETKMDHLASPGPIHMSYTSTFEGRPISTPPAVVHHNEPPSPPSSIVSTEFARGLHSRPPTEYDHSRRIDQHDSVVLLRPIPRYAEPNPGPNPCYEETPTHTTMIPVEPVGVPGRQTPSVDGVGSAPGNPTPVRSNLTKRTSYRKPVPPLVDPQLLESAASNISKGNNSQPIENGGDSSAAHEKYAFEIASAQGFASGRRYPLDQRGDDATLDGSGSETPIFGTNRQIREVGSSTDTYATESAIGTPRQAQALRQVRPVLVSRFTSTTDHLPLANGAPSPLGEPGVQFAARPDPREIVPSVLFWPEGMPASSRGNSPGVSSSPKS